MERRLGLMAGAGPLPARAASAARRQGWRVVAFAFDEAPGLAAEADAVIPASLSDVAAVLSALGQQETRAVLFAGKLWKRSLFSHAPLADEAGRRIGAGGLSDATLAATVVATLGALGIEVLDPRPFLASWLVGDGWPGVGGVTSREPSPTEWDEIHAGLAVARLLARSGIGQTVVRSRGVTVAVEAAEGTDETIRRGARLAGPGAVVIKAVAPAHDFRFDIPGVGAGTVAAMAAGGATALAVERGRVLLVDPEETIRAAVAADIAVVGVDVPAGDG